MATARRSLTDRLIDIAAGIEPLETALKDRRAKQRTPYDAYVAFLLVAPTGDRGRPLVLRAKDISFTGISVIGRHMIYPGSEGAMQLVRSDGRMALVGVSVRASRYIGHMQHHTGMAFVPLPPGVTAHEFLDRDGRMILMDPRLRENIDE